MAQSLIVASCVVVGVLGLVHAWLTFFSNRFDVRDASVQQALTELSPRLTRQTTFWRAGVGFHASHSAGAVLFSLVFGYLAIAQAPLLLQSVVLFGIGALYLSSLTLLAWRYWFNIPQLGTSIATLLFIAGWCWP